MKDALKDLVSHTFALNNIDLVKITGTDKETLINAIAEDRSVIVEAKYKKPMKEFVGTFGMPNLSKLNTILGLSEYETDAKLTISLQDRNGVSTPVGIHFENKDGDFKNDYRFMSSEIINDKIKAVKFKGVKWNVDFVPTELSIARLSHQTQANSEETTFIAKTEGKDLKFFFGDAASHAGSFVFQSGVSGTVSKAWAWPVGAINAILKLTGDKTFKIADEGCAMITVDSGIAEYSYIIPGQTK